MIKFKALETNDFPLLCKWLNTNHVAQWWGENKHWTLNEIQEKYSSYVNHYKIENKEKKAIYSFIIQFQEIPIGYIQFYDAYDFVREFSIKEHPLPLSLAAVDFYIGETSYLGKGLGSLALKQFLEEHVFLHFSTCLVDPDINNHFAIRCYENAGFKLIKQIKDINIMISTLPVP